MLRTVPRAALRQSALPMRPQRTGLRFQSTGPIKRRSFKNSLARWGIAIGGIYWYNTSPIFNEPPAYTIQGSGSDGEEALPTIASVAASSRLRPPHPSESPIIPSTPTANSPPSINPKSPDPRDPQAPRTGPVASEGSVSTGDPSALQEEAAQQGAFNEETGEINWDCPCLGGMAYGPCGQDFRDAFSCFVYSDKEPKGIDCIDNFEKMQLCFRAHPEIYASEIEDDENTQRELEEEVARETLKPASTAGMPDVDQPSIWTPGFEEPAKGDVKQSTEEAKVSSPPQANSLPAPTSAPLAKTKPKAKKEKKEKKPVYDEAVDSVKDTAESVKERALAVGHKVKEEFGPDPTRDEADSAVPKAAHDAR